MPEMHGFELVGMAGQALEDVEHERRKCAESGDEKAALKLSEVAILLMCETSASDARLARRLCALVARLNSRAVSAMEGGPSGHTEARQYLSKALAVTAKPMAMVLSNREERLRLRSTTLNNLGCLFRRMGKVHAALKNLEMALEIEVTLVETPESAGTHLNLCAILLQLKEPRVALKHARTALDKLLRRLNLGDSTQLETDEALSEAELKPEELPHARSLAIGYENLSCCHEANGSIAKAMASHDRAVAIAERHFGGDPITASIGVRGPHLKQLMAAHQTAAAGSADSGAAGGGVKRRVSPRASARMSGRTSGRTHHSGRGGGGGAGKGTDSTTLRLPAIGGASNFVPIKPVRPRKAAKPRAAFAQFGSRKTAGQHARQPGEWGPTTIAS